MPIKYDTNIFKKISIEVHGDKYDYSLVNYKNNSTNVKIICPFHGVFEQRPDVHFRGGGCIKCSLFLSSKKLRLGKDKFIEKSRSIHGDKYNYSLVDYKNNSTNVKIICPFHGVFEQQPRSHTLNKSGCPRCAGKGIDTKIFISNCKGIHGDKYDYSLVEYKNAITKITVICDKNHRFDITPNNHLSGRGCPICKESRGERIISKVLEDLGIKFIKQHMFDGCSYKRRLKFDFYLPDENICIEFDGEQHFKKYRFEKNNENLNIRKKRDEIKNEYCSINNIRLIRISYNKKEKEIIEILSDSLIE